MDACVYFHIVDPYKAKYKVENLAEAVRGLTNSVLRDLTGGYLL
jgi:regulator of protease activity HflC (stomatin/prohibitin superfamily)